MHPNIASEYYPKETKIIHQDIPSLTSIILADKKLQKLYSADIFILKVDDIEYKLESQIIKNKRDIIYITDESRIKLYIKHSVSV